METKKGNKSKTVDKSVEKKENDFDFSGIVDSISTIKQMLTALNQQIKQVDKAVAKKMKKLERENKKAKNKGNRQPSGFANPTKISKELCEFMEKPTDTKMARTDVTKYIIQYIKENNLQDPKNAKVIKPNKKLTTLLKIDSTNEVLTYFNIQRHMNKHFIKSS